MPFILTAQRTNENAFTEYRRYLTSSVKNFPPHAYALANSDWYFDFSEKSPHDARLLSCTIEESTYFNQGIAPKIKVKLLNASDTGHIEFEYPEVYSYSLNYSGSSSGHMDWRYDEIRVSDDGHAIHEIEWWGPIETGRWIIEASDVLYKWSAK